MNIVIAGVGGQGTLLASRVLGKYAELKGFDCKLSEVHGMAQRGGSVITYVKMSDKVYSPIIGSGDADILIAFEELEALRWSHCLKAGGKLIVNTQRIMPLPVIIGAAEYPSNPLAELKGKYEVCATDALKIALECGNAKAVNTVMLGETARAAGLDYPTLKAALTACVPSKLLEVNLAALEQGYQN